MDERELLREYVDRRSEQAFAELVGRHVNLVYSAAWRVLRQPAPAQEATQTTFILLARKAESIRQPEALGGWLYRAATSAALNLLRSEQRRRQRETEAVNRAELNAETDAAWEAMVPVLEEAMRRLKPVEQDALVLRYFEGHTLREASRKLAMSEAALQKRIARALEKLRHHFSRKGVTVAVPVIAGALSLHGAEAAPAGLVASLTSASLAEAASAGAGPWSSLLKFLGTTKLQTATLGLLLVAGLATPTIVRSQIQARQAGRSRFTASAGQTTPSLAAEAAQKETVITVPVNTALARLQVWLAQPGRWPLGTQETELKQLLQALGQEEFPSAWALRERLQPRSWRQHYAALLMGRWTAVDQPAALAATLADADKAERRLVLVEVISVWADRDPLAAASWINAFYPALEQPSKLMLVFWRCYERNPAAARAVWEQLPAGYARDEAAQNLIRTLAKGDPQAAHALWQQLPPGFARDEAAKTFAQTLAEQDLSAAVASLNDIQSAHLRKDARDHILFEWAKTDAAGAMASAQAQAGLEDRDDAVRAVINGVAQKDPARAAQLLGSLSTKAVEQDRGTIASVVGEWARRDVSAAAAWSRELPEGPLRDRALREVVVSWATQDAPKAAAFCQALPEANQAQWLGWVARAWAGYDSQAALKWLNTLPEGPGRNAGLSGFADGLAGGKPEAAAHFVAGLPPGELQAEAALKVVSRWAYYDPASAGAWVAAFPPGATRDQAAAQLVQQWRKRDAPAAEAWWQHNGRLAEKTP